MDGIIDLNGGLYIDPDTIAAAGFRSGQSVRIHVRNGQILLARTPERVVVVDPGEPVRLR